MSPTTNPTIPSTNPTASPTMASMRAISRSINTIYYVDDREAADWSELGSFGTNARAIA